MNGATKKITDLIRLAAVVALVTIVAWGASTWQHRQVTTDDPLLPAPVADDSPKPDAAATLTFGADVERRDGWILNDTKNVVDFARDVSDGYRKDGKVEGRVEILLPKNMRSANASAAAKGAASAGVCSGETKCTQPPEQPTGQTQDANAGSPCSGGSCNYRQPAVEDRWYLGKNLGRGRKW